MSFLTILDTLLLGPLKLVFEIIYVIANRFIGNPGLAIIVLSLIMNVLVLPLYRRADAMQEAARDVEAKLHRGVAHIKKVFSGDERMMILQTYYRQNDYRPTDALNGSVSLLLEIPFFMAAYQFLSQLDLLKGVPFGPIADLSAPDGLLVLGSMTINLLPILMTAINVVSSMIYLKGFPLKTKIQLYGMAAFFLVFLYNSPSGLVFYWTLNNLFSLGKTIFYKLKHAKTVGAWVLSLAGFAALVFGLFLYNPDSWKRKFFVIGIGIAFQLPILLHMLGRRMSIFKAKHHPQPNKKLFLYSCIFLTILIGAVIPSTFIAASPQEFVDINFFHNPLWYILSSLCYSAGTFLIWIQVFYWLATPKGKVFMQHTVWVLCGAMLTTYMLFGTDLGILNPNLTYVNGLVFSSIEQFLNLITIAIIAAVMLFISSKWPQKALAVLLTASISLGIMTIPKLVTISKSMDNLISRSSQDDGKPYFTMSKNGQNVVVVMLDRTLAQMVPFIMEEKPELKEQFDGFTFYDNTISFGGYTNFGTPALLGGYEYTPVELNKRNTESLKDKQNEALKVMPVVFLENGYQVTICDPPYANYQWTPDLSIYDDYPEIKAYNTEGLFFDNLQKQMQIQTNHRNFFCFSLMKTLPVVLQPNFYTNGTYNAAEIGVTTQVQYSLSEAEGLLSSFMETYSVLTNLPYMTTISQNNENTFLFLYNGTGHEPVLLQAPDYVPAQHVDNTEYDAAHADRFTVDGRTLNIQDPMQMAHYHANMAALLQMGKWFDHLRENGVYDNTRIILVSDHGTTLSLEDSLIHGNKQDIMKDAAFFYPLLMAKDFNSREYTVSSEFMTNADVPSLAMDGLIDDPINPFTEKPINCDEKYAHPQYIICSTLWDIAHNNGNTFQPSRWASVSGNIWDPSSWNYYENETVLAEHSFPQK